MLNQFREKKWVGEIEAMVLDPKLARRLIELGEFTLAVDESVKSDDAKLHFESVLNACRRSRSIRMLVGRLNRMQPEARNFAEICLNILNELFFSPDKIAAENREDFNNAVTNIKHRLSLLVSDDYEFVLSADDSFSNLLGA